MFVLFLALSFGVLFMCSCCLGIMRLKLGKMAMSQVKIWHNSMQNKRQAWERGHMLSCGDCHRLWRQLGSDGKPAMKNGNIKVAVAIHIASQHLGILALLGFWNFRVSARCIWETRRTAKTCHETPGCLSVKFCDCSFERLWANPYLNFLDRPPLWPTTRLYTLAHSFMQHVVQVSGDLHSRKTVLALPWKSKVLHACPNLFLNYLLWLFLRLRLHEINLAELFLGLS